MSSATSLACNPATACARDGGKRVKGIACKWHDRGFGFIKPNDGGEDVFCHVSGLQSGNCLREGDEVEFEVAWDERQNKYRATEVSGGIQDDYIQSSGVRSCLGRAPEQVPCN